MSAHGPSRFEIRTDQFHEHGRHNRQLLTNQNLDFVANWISLLNQNRCCRKHSILVMDCRSVHGECCKLVLDTLISCHGNEARHWLDARGVKGELLLKWQLCTTEERSSLQTRTPLRKMTMLQSSKMQISLKECCGDV